MDHAIDGLQVFFEMAYEDLANEWKSGKYKKLSDCPSFKEASAYRKAMNVLVKACYLPDYVQDHLIPPLSKRIREQFEVEKFWDR
ncbi:hypothetical protein [Bacillus litorisediminis]|uniref:hypothetical protein n=1 Tax=Bacillus litorisediminis TaxID=2922713 RepID=UPI001FAEE613|nr:hypothetical protein [Bacillus litorisediminis]